MNTSSDTLATSIPTNRFTSSMFHPPQPGLPRLAIRDFFPLQPFGLSAIGVAATLAARRDLAPKGAPVFRSTNSDSSTKSSTYKGVEERANFENSSLIAKRRSVLRSLEISKYVAIFQHPARAVAGAPAGRWTRVPV